MRVVIVGNGIAGINVAQLLRAEPSVEVSVYGEETHPFYSRVRLPEVLSGKAEPESIAFYKPDWYEKRGITVHTDCRVVSIDRAAKRVSLASGEGVPYDWLVLALGAEANRPKIPGVDLDGVFTLRAMDDVAAIRARLFGPGRRAACASVVGGGLLGLEAARALKDAGVGAVRVLEIAPRLLPRQLDETGATLLRKRFAAMGIEVVVGVEVKALRDGSIELADGRVFPSDATILSMGVHSNVALAKEAGLATGRGIAVDERMRTSDPSIFAVGDCAEFAGVVWGIIPAALEQAPVAAKAILAAAGSIKSEDAPRYVQTVPKTALKVGDIELMSLGKAVPSEAEIAAEGLAFHERVWDGEIRYERYVTSGEADSEGRFPLVGAILYGSKVHQSWAQKLMGARVSGDEIAALLAE